MGQTETAMWTEPTKHSCAKGFPVNWSSTKSRVTRSICRQTRSANVAPPWEEKRVPILEKVTMCVQPPTSLPPPHILPVSFLVRACASKTSKIVKMSVYQRCKNIQLCLFFSFFGEKFIFAVDPVHCWSPLVHRSIQNNFTFLFLFLTCTSNFFLSRVLELTTAIYYISIIYVNF